MKKLGIVFVIVLVLVVGLFLFKNIIAKSALRSGVKSMTGLGLEIKEMDVGIVKTLLGIKGLKLLNPKGFSDKVMVDLPEIYVDYDFGAFLQKKIHLREVRLNLAELFVVKNTDGKLNLNSLKAMQSQKEKKPKGKGNEKGEVPKIAIDLLILKIGKVVYKDYSKGSEPSTREFKINIDERFENITDPQSLTKLILQRCLFKTSIASLTGFDVDALKVQASEVVLGATKAVADTTDQAKEAAQEAADKAKKELEGVTEDVKDLFKF